MEYAPWTPEVRNAHKEQTQKIIDNFKKAFNKTEPKIVYHYSTTDNLKKILESNFFRATQISKLNDESEYDYGLVLAKNLIMERHYDQEFTNLVLQKIDDYISKKDYIFVLSLSLNGDSLPLWQKYSDAELKGYNLGFFYRDIDTIYSRCNGKIIYSNDEQKRILFELVDGLEEYYRHTKEIADTFSLQFINEWHWDALISYFTLFKHSNWSVEEEYRVVYLINESWTECLVKEKYGPKPFIEIPICHYDENRCDLPLWEIGIASKNTISDKEVKLLFPKVKIQYADINRSKIPLR